MTKAKTKCKAPSRTNGSRIKDRSSTVRLTPSKTVKPKPALSSRDEKRAQSSARKNRNVGSKQSRIIAMLRAPHGATIEAMAHAMEWRPHSVRGFLAGVVRKKLGLNLVSAAAESGRIYRITDQKPLSGATTNSAKAA
ncbi:MAG: DUF3489 domain-containing protein [Pseudolabrys sp.]|nr:DUF3489 domain-containing protein [Pseudolabrys sp.]